MSNVILSAHGLSKVFSEGPRQLTVLEACDLELSTGDMLAIVGASGSGKSTLLNLLAGLDTPTTGEVHLAGRSLLSINEASRCRLRNQHLGFVFQFHHLLPEFTALENVAMPCLLAGLSPAKAKARAKELLQQVGLSERLGHKPGELSGGERQRVAIARALVNRPGLVMADEPTGNLDEATAVQVQQLLFDLNRELGTAFLLVTHDNHFASQCKTRLRLHEGRLMSI